MSKKGKKFRREEQEEPVKKKFVITEEQLMDQTHRDKTQFIPMIISQSLYQPFIFNDVGQAALKKIVTDLNYLLYIDFKNFWATVLYNPSLKACLSSCLSYLHRRWLNNYKYSNQSSDGFEQNQQNWQGHKKIKDEPIYQYTQGLMEVLLYIYHRIVNFNYENKELSVLYKIGDQISRKYILDLPRLFQLAEIYGETNPLIVRHIIKMYSSTVPNFYKTVTQIALPIIFKRMQDILRGMKTLSEREEFSINYSYKRLANQALSQGEEQLKRKVNMLMELISFQNIINIIIQHFPDDCVDHCFFNSQIQFIYQNIFLQIEFAYKIWNYQTQDVKLLNMINYILKGTIDYFVRYFQRCNNIIVLHHKSSTFEAYINSLGRVFKQYGKRYTVSKKNQKRNLLMYKIIHKQFNIQQMCQQIFKEQEQNGFQNFNIDYMKDFIIALDNELKEDQYIAEEEPRQEQIEAQTQAEIEGRNDEDFKQVSDVVQQKPIDLKILESVVPSPAELSELQCLVPKRNRSQDYYTKLYSDFNKKCYKGEYQDDYDDITDFDKRPIFFEQESSNSESDGEVERHLVSNSNNLSHVKEIHNQHKVITNSNRNNVNQPKYSRVNNNYDNSNTGNKKYQQKNEQFEGEETKKIKYVQKSKEPVQEQFEDHQKVEEKAAERNIQYRQKQQQTEQKRGGQGFKKSNKSYNYKPKDGGNNDHLGKGQNKNKNKDYENGGAKKTYKQKY